MTSFPDLYTLIDTIDTGLTEAMRSPGPAHQALVPVQEKMTKYILVATGTLHLAIAIDDLSEVGPLPALTILPNLPPWIQGIVNVRSEITSVIDLPGFLKLGGRGVCVGNRFVVLQYRKQKIGIRLDRIVGTVSRAATETKPLDYVDNNQTEKYLFAAGLLVENTLYYILNVRRLLTAPSLIDFRGR